MTHTFQSFTDLVHKSRLAATRYYELAAKSRKTKYPDDFKASKDALAIAKGLEAQVDAAIVDIKKMFDTPEPTPESKPAPKSYFETENF
jgi:hypothetical protein